MNAEPIAVTLLVVDALEALDLPYFIGGSLASAFYGVPRSTLDADLVVDLQLADAEPLADRLRPAFYVDAEMIREAIRTQSSFNVIHLETMFKVDIFIWRARAFDQAQMDRRTAVQMATDPERQAYVATAEDTILAKLEWYRLGGTISERQWHDILGVIQAVREQLDLAYLHKWAQQLGVSDLLRRALQEADAGTQGKETT